MRVSDLFQQSGGTFRLETQTDAIQVISNDFQRGNYIEKFGDVVIKYDEAANVYRVPEFAPAIARYNEAKTRDCQRWGCE